MYIDHGELKKKAILKNLLLRVIFDSLLKFYSKLQREHPKIITEIFGNCNMFNGISLI